MEIKGEKMQKSIISDQKTLNKENLILIKKLKKTYKDGGIPVEAVKGINLKINKGEFIAIAGPSGSGKTTLMNLMAGLDKATEGEVFLHGNKISEMSGGQLSDFRRDNIGFIFQAYNLIPVLTVKENIEYVMLLQGINREERKNRVKSILQDLGLENFEDKFVTKLSGGQQQRVAIARAMVSKPSIILADEPTANLDSVNSGNLLDIMYDLNQKTGMTFIFSTHDEIVKKRAKRLIIIKDGLVSEDINK